MYVKTTNKIAYWKNPYFQRKNRSNRTKSSDPNDAAVYMGDMSCHIFNCPSCMKGNFRDCDSIKSGFIGPWVRFEFGVDFTRGSKRSREWTYFWKLTKITKTFKHQQKRLKLQETTQTHRENKLSPKKFDFFPKLFRIVMGVLWGLQNVNINKKTRFWWDASDFLFDTI